MQTFQEMIKNADYLQAVHGLAKAYKITFEQMLERERKGFAEMEEQRSANEEAFNKQQAAKEKILKECVWFCYQDLGDDVYKYTNGEAIHGYYRIVKTDTCYEFTIMETDMRHESWQKRISEKHVTRFPLEVVMGTGSFKDVTPDKIY